MKKAISIANSLFFVSLIVMILHIEGFNIFTNYLKDVGEVDDSFINQIKESHSIQQGNDIKLTCDGQALPYFDKKSNTFLFSEQLIDRITIDTGIGFTVVKCISDTDKYVEILAYTDKHYQTYKIQLTSLAVIDISCPSHDYDSEDYSKVTMVLFDPDNQRAIDAHAEIKVRGHSSKFYEKKSYTIKLMDDFRSKYYQKQLLNLRVNSKYALDSIYEDDSKIRNMLSNELWKEFGAKSNPYGIDNSLSRAYVEMIINGEYHGLYGLQEIVDETNFSIDPFEQAAIFKINSYADFTSATPNPALSTLGTSIDGDVESVYSSLSRQKWDALLAFFNSIKGDEIKNVFKNYLDADNYIDYYILVKLAYAIDNLQKNLVLTQRNRNNTSTFIITPWDFDITFGAVWDTNVARSIRFDSSVATKEGIDVLNVFGSNIDNMQNKISKRWFELRDSIFQQENLLNRANGYYDFITDSGARKRDAERWPNSAISQDNSFIEQYIKERLSFLDDFFSQYL